MRVSVPFLRRHFRLAWHGIHGAPHWARVAYNGQLLAGRIDGVNHDIVRAFALCHDLARVDDGRDSGHGDRAVRLLERHGGAALLGLQDASFAELCGAMAQHSEAVAAGTITQQVCWDADRLDLWRIGIMPDPDRFFTAAARELHFDRLYDGFYR